MAFDFKKKPSGREGSEGYGYDGGYGGGYDGGYQGSSGGFTNYPEMSSGGDDYGSDYGSDGYSSDSYSGGGYDGYSGLKRPRRWGAMDWGSAKIWLYVIGIALVIVLLVVFKDEILAFLAQVVSMLIVIAIVILVFKWLIFGGRRR